MFPRRLLEGDRLGEVFRRASEALEAALSFYIDENRDIPKPSKRRGRLVGLPALSEAKVALYQAMRRGKVTRAELARRLGWQKSQVGILLDLNHESRLDQIEAALAALGKKLEVRVSAA